MGPLPDEDEYDNLPYTLPPGPYSPNKPDLSYAALVGQAILSSPEHRLTLQEIYDWITIVYPHFKRGEQTWMNSIRHVLSTTVCFRKVPRERSVGRTLWAIFDEDLECFKGGGFRKQLCPEIAGSAAAKEKAGSSRTRSKGRKREADDGPSTDTRKTKRTKKSQAVPGMLASIPANPTYILPAPLVSHPLFPATRATPHHQPYYESCLPQPHPIPAEVIFPPLPPAAAYNQIAASRTSISASASESQVAGAEDLEPVSSPTSAEGSSDLFSGTHLPSSASSSSLPSVPALTPARGSSSPPTSSLSAGEMDPGAGARTDEKDTYDISAFVNVMDGDGEEGDGTLFDGTLLGPVRFWGESPKTALKPGLRLRDFRGPPEDEVEDHLVTKSAKAKKGKAKVRFCRPVFCCRPC